MNKCCRTCRHFENGLCFHPAMSTEEIDIYSEYVEPLFDGINHIDSSLVKIINVIEDHLKENLPVEEMHFSPADYREFYCSLYE